MKLKDVQLGEHLIWKRDWEYGVWQALVLRKTTKTVRIRVYGTAVGGLLPPDEQFERSVRARSLCRLGG